MPTGGEAVKTDVQLHPGSCLCLSIVRGGSRAGTDGAVTRADGGGCARFRFLQGEMIRVEPRGFRFFVYMLQLQQSEQGISFFPPSSWGALHLECTKLLLCKKGQTVYVMDTAYIGEYIPRFLRCEDCSLVAL